MKQYSLTELGSRIYQTINREFNFPLWVIAEIAEIKEHGSGHCYLELIEKSPDNEIVLARMRAQAWAQTYRMIKPYFETTTGSNLTVGMKVLIQVSVTFHEVFGLSLTIKDIEPTFTVGEIVRKRLKIIKQLEDDGCLDMNRELDLASLPQRVAIISSDSAAGYGDFMNQLQNNSYGYIFYHKLFTASMQGSDTEESIISALDQISKNAQNFDVVAIIRGGGASLDLATFDNYNIALNVAQFPLPIIVGIGHERDETVLDLVCYKSLKTPTAAADFLIDEIDKQSNHLSQLSNKLVATTQKKVLLEIQRLQEIKYQIMNTLTKSLSNESQNLVRKQGLIQQISTQSIVQQKHKLELYTNRIAFHNPIRIMSLGYSQTTSNGKRIRSIAEIKTGQTIHTQLIDGEFYSVVE